MKALMFNRRLRRGDLLPPPLGEAWPVLSLSKEGGGVGDGVARSARATRAVTLALSQRERGLNTRRRRSLFLPLPLGEGWGEGDGRRANHTKD